MMNTKRIRPMTLGLLVAGGMLLTACGNDAGAADGVPATTPVASSAPATTTTVALDPALAAELDRIAGELGMAGAPATEVACVRSADGLDTALDCLGIESLVADQARYLGESTDATEAQIACVTNSLRELGVERARELAFEGIGEAVYVPCGLPD